MANKNVPIEVLHGFPHNERTERQVYEEEHTRPCQCDSVQDAGFEEPSFSTSLMVEYWN